jgi:hypothetical protein
VFPYRSRKPAAIFRTSWTTRVKGAEFASRATASRLAGLSGKAIASYSKRLAVTKIHAHDVLGAGVELHDPVDQAFE